MHCLPLLANCVEMCGVRGKHAKEMLLMRICWGKSGNAGFVLGGGSGEREEIGIRSRGRAN